MTDKEITRIWAKLQNAKGYEAVKRIFHEELEVKGDSA